MRGLLRILAASFACALFALSLSGSARAGEDAGALPDGTVFIGLDGSLDGDLPGQCVAIGYACSPNGRPCCSEGAYCGAFGGATNGNLQCGYETDNSISTGGCSVRASGAETPLWAAVFGIALVACAVRQSRKRR